MANLISLSSVLPTPMPIGPTNAASAAQNAASQRSDALSALLAPKQGGPTNTALAEQHSVKSQSDQIVSSTTTATTAESHDIRNAAAQHGFASGDHHGSTTGRAPEMDSGGLAIPLTRGAIAGAAEFSFGAASVPLVGGALLAASQSAPPVSREQATAIAAAEKANFAGKASDHVFSPYSNLQADQALPTQAQLDSRSLTYNELAPLPRAGVSPASGMVTNELAAGTMLKYRDARSLAPSMPAGVSVREVNCQKPPKPEYDSTRKAFDGTYRNGFQDGVKANYIKHVATNNPSELTKLGFNQSQIETMAASGRTPTVSGQKVEVHHILPLECGGTNDFDNLTMVRQDVHKPLTEAQFAATNGLEYGQSRQIELLITPKGTMYPSSQNALQIPELQIP